MVAQLCECIKKTLNTTLYMGKFYGIGILKVYANKKSFWKSIAKALCILSKYTL